MSGLPIPPTPWGVNDDGDVADEGGELVAINPRLGSFPAHLIAAAPELYEALEALCASVACEEEANGSLSAVLMSDMRHGLNILARARSEHPSEGGR